MMTDIILDWCCVSVVSNRCWSGYVQIFFGEFVSEYMCCGNWCSSGVCVVGGIWVCTDLDYSL